MRVFTRALLSVFTKTFPPSNFGQVDSKFWGRAISKFVNPDERKLYCYYSPASRLLNVIWSRLINNRWNFIYLFFKNSRHVIHLGVSCLKLSLGMKRKNVGLGKFDPKAIMTDWRLSLVWIRSDLVLSAGFRRDFRRHSRKGVPPVEAGAFNRSSRNRPIRRRAAFVTFTLFPYADFPQAAKFQQADAMINLREERILAVRSKPLAPCE